MHNDMYVYIFFYLNKTLKYRCKITTTHDPHLTSYAGQSSICNNIYKKKHNLSFSLPVASCCHSSFPPVFRGGEEGRMDGVRGRVSPGISHLLSSLAASCLPSSVCVSVWLAVWVPQLS